MRRDSIFYRLFKQFPGLLFELVDDPPTEASRYQFESVEVKETAFRMDGVFLPPDDAMPNTVFFAEVQFQKDEDLYHRFFSELFLFLYRHSVRYPNWFGVLIFGDRSLEPTDPSIHQVLLNSPQVRRIYLNELGDWRQQPLGLGLMLLTIATEPDAVEAARFFIQQAPQQSTQELSEQAIIDLITTIMVYKFTALSREEIETMLGLNLEESRVYQDAKAAGREEGLQVGLQAGREAGREEGLQAGQSALVLRLLTLQVGKVHVSSQTIVRSLALADLEELGEALLEFTQPTDLITWLQHKLGNELNLGESSLDA